MIAQKKAYNKKIVITLLIMEIVLCLINIFCLLVVN